MKFEHCFVSFSKPGTQWIACQWDSNLWGQGHGCFQRATADSDLHLRSNAGICWMRELSRTQLLHFLRSTYFYKSIQILHDSSLAKGTGASWIQETHLKRFKYLRTGCQSLVSHSCCWRHYWWDWVQSEVSPLQKKASEVRIVGWIFSTAHANPPIPSPRCRGLCLYKHRTHKEDMKNKWEYGIKQTQAMCVLPATQLKTADEFHWSFIHLRSNVKVIHLFQLIRNSSFGSPRTFWAARFAPCSSSSRRFSKLQRQQRWMQSLQNWGCFQFTQKAWFKMSMQNIDKTLAKLTLAAGSSVVQGMFWLGLKRTAPDCCSRLQVAAQRTPLAWDNNMNCHWTQNSIISAYFSHIQPDDGTSTSGSNCEIAWNC